MLPIERIVSRSSRGQAHAWYSFSKEVQVLVWRDAEGVRSIDLQASAVPLDQWRQRVPELDALLASIAGPGRPAY